MALLELPAALRRNLAAIENQILALTETMDNHGFYDSLQDLYTSCDWLRQPERLDNDMKTKALEYLAQASYKELPSAASERESFECLFLAYLLCENARVYLAQLCANSALNGAIDTHSQANAFVESLWLVASKAGISPLLSDDLEMDPSERAQQILLARYELQKKMNPHIDFDSLEKAEPPEK